MFAHTFSSIRAQIKLLEFKTKNCSPLTVTKLAQKGWGQSSSKPILYLWGEIKNKCN
jgi:hypothetical protein